MLFSFFCFIIIVYNIMRLLGVVNLRIIAGSLRGLTLDTLPGLDTRPTADRVKEALFSSLTPCIMNARVLDAFSGSGALALESLSRGASFAVMCENSKAAHSVCKKNIEKSRLSDRTSLLLTDAVSYIKSSAEKFDIIFLDPPYAKGLYEEFLINTKGRLNPGGIIIVEYEEAHTPVVPDFLTVTKHKKYGRVNLIYLSGVDES